MAAEPLIDFVRQLRQTMTGDGDEPADGELLQRLGRLAEASACEQRMSEDFRGRAGGPSLPPEPRTNAGTSS